MQERPLTDQQKEQIRMNLESGMKLIRSKHPDLDVNDTGKIVRYLSLEMASDAIFLPEAAAVLSHCIENAAGWKTVTLSGDRFTGTAVVSPDGAYAAYPELVAGKASRDPENHSLLSFFHMIKSGSLPPSSPGGYTVLSTG